MDFQIAELAGLLLLQYLTKMCINKKRPCRGLLNLLIESGRAFSYIFTILLIHNFVKFLSQQICATKNGTSKDIYPPGRMSEAIPLGVHLIFLFFICTSICTPKPIGLYEEEDPDKKVL